MTIGLAILVERLLDGFLQDLSGILETRHYDLEELLGRKQHIVWCVQLDTYERLEAEAERVRRARQRGEPSHSISWIEFVPIVLITTAATFLVNRWHDGLGYQIVGGLHLALILPIAAVAFRRRAKRVE